MLKKIFAVLAAAVIGLTTSLSVGAPAQAALSDCTAYSRVVCLWKYSQAGGSIWRQTDSQIPATSCRKLSESGWNNSVSYARNNTPGIIVELYDGYDTSCNGTHLDLYYGYNYELTGTVWDERASSISYRIGTGPLG